VPYQAGYQPAAVFQQPSICIQITDTGHIVNAALFSGPEKLKDASRQPSILICVRAKKMRRVWNFT